MPDEVVELLFSRVFESRYISDSITIAWHAGEPLVPGTEYYKRVFEIIERLRPENTAVHHNFQTNGTLIDDRWIEFFREHNAAVGISLDGPQRLHDAHRRTRNGKGTFDATMRGLRRMKDACLPFHVIAVLTREALDCAEEIHKFFLWHGIERVGFNVEELEGGHTSSSLAEKEAEAALRLFYSTIIRLNECGERKLQIRELSGAFSVIEGRGTSGFDNPQVTPMQILSCDVDGNLSTFSPELLGYSSARYGPFIFGNVRTHSLDSILEDERFTTVLEDIERGVARCRAACPYFEVCGGGAPANKLFENGSFDSDETLYCRLTRKALIDVMLDHLEAKLEISRSEPVPENM
jgi:uncharacterized protein